MRKKKNFPKELPIIIEEENFLYPFMITPLFLTDKDAINGATYALENNSLVLVSTKNNKGFYDVGVIGSVIRKVELPDKRIKILFQGLTRGVIEDLSITKEDFLVGMINILGSEAYDANIAKLMIKNLQEQMKKLANVSTNMPYDIVSAIDEDTDPDRIVDLVCSAINLEKDDAYRVYKETDVETRLIETTALVLKQIEAAKLQKEIRSKVHNKIDKVNKEYFLKEQLKQIKRELGEDSQKDEELKAIQEKLDAKKPHMHPKAYLEISKQISRLSRLHQDSSDAAMLQTYVEWALDLPFGEYSKGKLSVKEVETRLNKDHYSLQKAKDRISEFFAVQELLEKRNLKNTDTKGTILCFVGPPGVGKTSLANSIAKALKKELVRIALGGMEDVNELRGHRRTYIGAMPGRITQGLIDAKSMDPVIVLDEIDKIGNHFRGDPAAALLEILDPEQNSSFRDYYLNFELDLSRVIFISTANDASKIPPALKDRLEIIEISSYTPLEKFEIAKQYLVTQELKKHGLLPKEVLITDACLKEIIDKYTREAGVRNLRRQLANIIRKSAKEILKGEKQKITINPKNLQTFLPKKVFEIEEVSKQAQIGVVNGLAWTSVGGDVLKIESILIKGKGDFELTGSLGDVMKESAKIALSVVKSLIDQNVIKAPTTQDKDKNILPIYKTHNLHIHVPEGAVPKDGPSAGIAMASAIASIFSAQKISQTIAMTGELTLSGKVLPIGGLKEKLIAAHKAKISKVLIPRKNYNQDLIDIPDEVKQSMTITAVDEIKDVIKEIF